MYCTAVLRDVAGMTTGEGKRVGGPDIFSCMKCRLL